MTGETKGEAVHLPPALPAMYVAAGGKLVREEVVEGRGMKGPAVAGLGVMEIDVGRGPARGIGWGCRGRGSCGVWWQRGALWQRVPTHGDFKTQTQTHTPAVLPGLSGALRLPC